MHNLAYLYHDGYIGNISGKPNYDKALEWFNLAIENGHDQALKHKNNVLEAMSKDSITKDDELCRHSESSNNSNSFR